MSFEYPLVLLLIPIVFILLYKYKAKKRSIYFPAIGKFSKQINPYSFKKALPYLISFFMLISLASPVTKDDVINKKTKGYDISLILDASGSMAPGFSGIDKFAIVKEIVTDFAKKRKNDRLALSIFADFAYIAVPLTYDKKSLIKLLSMLDVGVAGQSKTALNEALFLSNNIFKNSTAKNKIAILLTDGANNVNNVPLSVAIDTTIKHKVKVYTVGVGDGYNEDVLTEIATKSGGKFYGASSVEELKNIYKVIDKIEKSEIESNKYVKKTYFFQYFLFVGFSLFGFII